MGARAQLISSRASIRGPVRLALSRANESSGLSEAFESLGSVIDKEVSIAGAESRPQDGEKGEEMERGPRNLVPRQALLGRVLAVWGGPWASVCVGADGFIGSQAERMGETTGKCVRLRKGNGGSLGTGRSEQTMCDESGLKLAGQ